MIKNQDNLQYVFACLLTHSKWIKRAKSSFDVVSNLFNLSTKDLTLLKNFLEQNSDRLLSNSLLAEEKRWREFLTTIKYINKIVPLFQLKNFWQQYLEKFTIHDPIPPTPLNESIAFLNYLITKKLNPVAIDIISYELARNTRSNFNFSESHQKDADIIWNDISNFYIELNPSFTFKKFEIDITTLIKQIDKLDKTDFSARNTQSYIAFYKNIKNNVVNTLQLNELLIKSLLDIKNEKLVNTWFDNSLTKYSSTLQSKLGLTKNLYLLGIVWISETKGSANVKA